MPVLRPAALLSASGHGAFHRQGTFRAPSPFPHGRGLRSPALRNALRRHSIFRAPRALSARLFRRGIPRSPVFPPCPAMASGCALPGICASFEKGLCSRSRAFPPGHTSHCRGSAAPTMRPAAPHHDTLCRFCGLPLCFPHQGMGLFTGKARSAHLHPELSRTAEGCTPPALRNALRKHSIFRAPRALSARLFRRGIPRSPVFPPCPAMAYGCALPGICASFEKGLYAAPFPCPKTAPQPANRSAATPAAQRRFDNMPYLPVSG